MFPLFRKVPEDAFSDAMGIDETTVFDAVTLRVGQKSTDLDSLKSSTNITATPVSSSPIDHLAWVFCFDNLLMDNTDGEDANVSYYPLTFQIICLLNNN